MPMPRFEPLQVLPADDLNVMAEQIERNGELFVGRSASNGSFPPQDARFKMQAFSASVTSNDGAFIDVLWPDGPFDQIGVAFVTLYGGPNVTRRIAVNWINNEGASFHLQDGNHSPLLNTSVTIQVLAIGWMLD